MHDPAARIAHELPASKKSAARNALELDMYYKRKRSHARALLAVVQASPHRSEDCVETSPLIVRERPSGFTADAGAHEP
jgi:hypothetical protein